MAASTFVPLTKTSQLAFLEYYRSAQLLQTLTRDDMRSRYEYIDRTYQREILKTTEDTRAKAANKSGDSARFQDMTIPVVMPQVEAAVTHQASVFLTGDPLFKVVAAPAFINEAMQLETILENDSIRGGWDRQLLLHFRDGFKYNFAPMEVDWKQQVTHVVETQLDKSLKEGVPKKVIWTGNSITRLDPYNTFVDTRVPASEVYKDGEFAGFTEIMSRIKLKKFIAELPDKIIGNIKPAFNSGRGTITSGVDSGSQSYYVPDINPLVTATDYKAGGTNWFKWAGLSDSVNKDIDYKDAYEVTTLYARILPSEFSLGVPAKNTPQIYKIIFVNHEHIIYAELQTNAHNYIPILIGQPLEDGLSYQTKSLATNGTSFQELATAYMTSILASKRRAISDRVLFDPSRIASAAINSANPSAKIPVRPAAYGKKLSESVYQFPYREDQLGSDMSQIQSILGIANQLTGQNPVSQGQFIKGNKTNSQFDDVMNNATGRDQMAALLLQTQVFSPMKEILKINILQFQGGTTLYNRDQQQQVEIDPIALRKAVLEFKLTDGLVDSDTVLNTESFLAAVQSIASDPGLRSGYNFTPMFSYLMKTQGADLTPFEKSAEQVAFEEALGAWQSLAQLALEKGIDPQKALAPQPLPADFGYDPTANSPTSPDEIPTNSPTPTGALI